MSARGGGTEIKMKGLISGIISYIDEMFPAFGNLNFRPKKSNYSYLSRQAGNALSDYINGAGTLENAAETMEKLLGKMSE